MPNKFRPGLTYEPKKCWVGEEQKICYDSFEEALMAARVAEYEHGISGLSVYKCEYGDHWHLTKGGAMKGSVMKNDDKM